MAAILYVVPASHPCAAIERALQAKGIDYRRVDLVPVFHKLHQLARFRGGSTVPGIVFDDGTKLLGSRAILRELERRVPEPALLPEDPEARKRVEQVEAWGDEMLQGLVRRVLWTALRRNTGALKSYSEGSKLVPPVPGPLVKLSGAPVSFLEKRINGADQVRVRADLQSLPGHLDRVERWIDEGVLGGETPNAADLQVAAALRLLSTLEDLTPMLDRPAGAYARRTFPSYPGRCPAGTLPAAWLPAAAVAHA
jgi:glutathione S-transferase